MNRELGTVVKESVQLEKKLAELYRRLTDVFPGESGFWRALAMEKEEHAIRLAASKNLFRTGFLLPYAFESDISTAGRILDRLDYITGAYAVQPPGKAIALNRALDLEIITGQFYVGLAQKLPHGAALTLVLRSIIAGNTDHSRRIHEKMRRDAAVVAPVRSAA